MVAQARLFPANDSQDASPGKPAFAAGPTGFLPNAPGGTTRAPDPVTMTPGAGKNFAMTIIGPQSAIFTTGVLEI
jgi:hypothetical protein